MFLADNKGMFSGNFEDSIFILKMRIRMIRDTLRLNPSSELYLERSVNDLVFIDSVLETLTSAVLQNTQNNGINSYESISDAEWEFNQVLTEFSLESSPFSLHEFPEAQKQTVALRVHSDTRRKTFEENSVVAEMVHTEPMVSIAEMSGLLGGI